MHSPMTMPRLIRKSDAMQHLTAVNFTGCIIVDSRIPIVTRYCYHSVGDCSRRQVAQLWQRDRATHTSMPKIVKIAFLPERDYVTFGYLLHVTIPSVCNVRALY